MGRGRLFFSAIGYGKGKKVVLDRYFDDITVERVDIEDDGWKKIEDNPLLWNSRALDFR